jgi:hypothetical protein
MPYSPKIYHFYDSFLLPAIARWQIATRGVLFLAVKKNITIG